MNETGPRIAFDARGLFTKQAIGFQSMQAFELTFPTNAKRADLCLRTALTRAGFWDDLSDECKMWRRVLK